MHKKQQYAENQYENILDKISYWFRSSSWHRTFIEILFQCIFLALRRNSSRTALAGFIMAMPLWQWAAELIIGILADKSIQEATIFEGKDAPLDVQRSFRILLRSQLKDCFLGHRVWRGLLNMISKIYFFLFDRPTGVDRGTGKRTEESVEFKGKSLQLFFVSRFHPRGITGFYLISVHMISRGLVMRISFLG